MPIWLLIFKYLFKHDEVSLIAIIVFPFMCIPFVKFANFGIRKHEKELGKDYEK